MQKSSTRNILSLNIIIMLLYSKAVRWTLNISVKRIITLVIFYLIMLIFIPAITYKSKYLAKKIDSISNSCINKLTWVGHHWKKMLFIVFIYFAVFCLFFLVSKLYALIFHQEYNYLISYSLVGIAYIILTVLFLRKSISQKPERLFFSVLLIIGTLYTCAMPVSVGLSWDDQIHYQRVFAIADYANNTVYQSEIEVFNTIYDTSLDSRYLSHEQNESFSKELNELYDADKTVSTVQCDYGVYSIAYVPYAVGILFGRALNVPFVWQLKIGKLFNIIFYGLIIALAMKKIKSGKILIASIGLFPTLIWQAVNFSYDSWVACLTIYGFATFFSFLQDKQKIMTVHEEFLMLSAFVLGCMPKAVYFIMMLPLFFLPQRVFSNKKQHQQYILLVFVSGLLLAFSFLLPMLINGAGSGDSRGGTDVNSTEQIKFILTCPGQYFCILMKFLIEYLDVANAPAFIQNYSYFGLGSFGILSVAVVGCYSVLDKNGEKNKSSLICFITVVGCFLAVVLVATALYVSFTVVRGDTVIGCQYRYILPILFPLLYMLTPDFVENRINKTLFNGFPMLFMGITFWINMIILVAPYCI